MHHRREQSSKLESQVGSTDQDLNQFVNQASSPFDLPQLGSKNQFIGKWFGNSKENQDQEQLKKESGEDQSLNPSGEEVEAQTSDFESWWGVERDGKKNSSTSDDNDDDDDGGEMMPVFDIPVDAEA